MSDRRKHIQQEKVSDEIEIQELRNRIKELEGEL